MLGMGGAVASGIWGAGEAAPLLDMLNPSGSRPPLPVEAWAEIPHAGPALQVDDKPTPWSCARVVGGSWSGADGRARGWKRPGVFRVFFMPFVFLRTLL